MNQKKQSCDQQKFLSQLKESISDLSRHIDFLNDENIAIRRLDVDLFKKRIHVIYELLCDFKPTVLNSYTETMEKPVMAVEKQEENKVATLKQEAEPDSFEKTGGITNPENFVNEQEQKQLIPVESIFENNLFQYGREVQKQEESVLPDNEKTQNILKEKDILIRFESPEETENEHRPVQSETFSVEPPVGQTDVLQSHHQAFDSKFSESIAERFVKPEDDSLAAKLQQQPIKELRSAIGINDKFLLLNELFSGNIEQYNKVMDEFEKFQTLNGARTFLLETKIDMQWDTQSEAYRKLESLIMRKYGII